MAASPFINMVAGAVVSGAVASAILGIAFHRYLTRVEQETRSRRTWKEMSVAELLGPMSIQLNRTERAFERWSTKNLYLEAKVVGEGNQMIRDLLLTKPHLIPPELLTDAGRLIEHYDVWLEKFAVQRLAEKPDLETAFVFVGPDGNGFPGDAATRFQDAFKGYWSELYGEG